MVQHIAHTTASVHRELGCELVGQHKHGVEIAPSLSDASAEILQILTRTEDESNIGFWCHQIIGKKARGGRQAVAFRLGSFARCHLGIRRVRVGPRNGTSDTEFLSNDVAHRETAGCRALPVVGSGNRVVAGSRGGADIEIHREAACVVSDIDSGGHRKRVALRARSSGRVVLVEIVAIAGSVSGRDIPDAYFPLVGDCGSGRGKEAIVIVEISVTSHRVLIGVFPACGQPELKIQRAKA